MTIFVKTLKILSRMTIDVAYIAGVLAGDGSLGVRHSKKEYSLKCVGNPSDEQEFYALLKDKFKKVFNITIKPRLYDQRTTFGFRIFSKELVLYLNEQIGLPIGKKDNRLEIPKTFIDDKKLRLYFIKGLFDTDGCISFKKKYKKYHIIQSSHSLEKTQNSLDKLVRY